MLNLCIWESGQILTKEIGIGVEAKEGKADNDSDTRTFMKVSHFRSTVGGIELFAYIAPMLRIPPTAIFVRKLICRFQTRNIGRIPSVKSDTIVKQL